MNRRSILMAGPIALAAGLLAASGGATDAVASRTRWTVRTSEGFDAIAFLGPLANVAPGRALYAADADAFLGRLPPDFGDQAQVLWQAARAAGVGLLGASLSYLVSSGGNDATIDTVIAALKDPDNRILPGFRQSPYWRQAAWDWFAGAAPDLAGIFGAMRAADFAGFRAERIGYLERRATELELALTPFDVTSWQAKLTGLSFDPLVEIVLLHFIKPHGVKVQGQTFLQSADYDTTATVRVACHEMLHPPLDRNGPAARAAGDVFRRDDLIMRIVREHDPNWGYHSLESLLEEDLVQALDQLISEALGVEIPAARRWRDADDGMHVIAAGLYGLLRSDRWSERGGSIETWLYDAALGGRLEGARFHAVASQVLGMSADRLWPARMS